MQGWHWGLRKNHAKIKKENHVVFRRFIDGAIF